MRSQEQKGAAFQALHSSEAFVIPNPWDRGQARMFAALGFKALATTSAGFAHTLGRLDGQVTLDEVVEHVRQHGGGQPDPGLPEAGGSVPDRAGAEAGRRG
jgi:2-methylisocitrate lyase-like PEP mutase family enzyme